MTPDPDTIKLAEGFSKSKKMMAGLSNNYRSLIVKGENGDWLFLPKGNRQQPESPKYLRRDNRYLIEEENKN